MGSGVAPPGPTGGCGDATPSLDPFVAVKGHATSAYALLLSDARRRDMPCTALAPVLYDGLLQARVARVTAETRKAVSSDTRTSLLLLDTDSPKKRAVGTRAAGSFRQDLVVDEPVPAPDLRRSVSHLLDVTGRHVADVMRAVREAPLASTASRHLEGRPKKRKKRTLHLSVVHRASRHTLTLERVDVDKHTVAVVAEQIAGFTLVPPHLQAIFASRSGPLAHSAPLASCVKDNDTLHVVHGVAFTALVSAVAAVCSVAVVAPEQPCVEQAEAEEVPTQEEACV